MSKRAESEIQRAGCVVRVLQITEKQEIVEAATEYIRFINRYGVRDTGAGKYLRRLAVAVHAVDRTVVHDWNAGREDRTNVCDDCGRPTPRGACDNCHPVITNAALATARPQEQEQANG